MRIVRLKSRLPPAPPPGNDGGFTRFEPARARPACGVPCLGGAVSAAVHAGRAFARPSNDGYLALASCILILTCVSTPLILGRSRVR
jgi:hypothetical protein